MTAASPSATVRSESRLRILLLLARLLAVLAAAVLAYLYFAGFSGRLVALTAGKLALLVVLVVLLHVRLRQLRRDTFGSAELARWEGPTQALGERPSAAGLCLGLTGSQLAMTAAFPLRPHILAIAATGSGKTTSLLRPNILLHQGASIVLDVKGEIAQADGAALAAQGRRVLAWDPEELLAQLPEGVSRTGIDITGGWEGVANWRGAFAESCVEQIFMEESKEQAFTEGARTLAKAIVARSLDSSAGRPVGLIGRIGDSAVTQLRHLSSSFAQFEGIADADLRRMVQMGSMFTAESNDRYLDSVVPQMRRELEFAAVGPIRQALAGDYALGQLLDGQCTDVLLLVVPASRIDRYARVLRLLFGSLGALAEHTAQERPANLLAALDEAAALGRADWLLRGLALHRSYGISYLLAFQSLAQLEGRYGPNAAREFVANCAALFFGVRDLETAEMVSRMLGERTAYALSRETGFGIGSAEREVAQRVMSAQQVLQLDHNRILAFLPGSKASMIDRIDPQMVLRIASA